jgi:hypothetical protein
MVLVVIIMSINNNGISRSEALLRLMSECAMTSIILQMLPHLAVAEDSHALLYCLVQCLRSCSQLSVGI